MSALLLTNPFAAQHNAQGQSQVAAPSLGGPGQSQAEAIGTAAAPGAVAPVPRGADSRAAGHPTTYAGSGGGAGGVEAQRPAWARRSPEATAGSVVAARAAALDVEQLDQMVRDATIDIMAARASVLSEDAELGTGAQIVDRAQQTRDMANQMPDPLPTAPVLRKN